MGQRQSWGKTTGGLPRQPLAQTRRYAQHPHARLGRAEATAWPGSRRTSVSGCAYAVYTDHVPPHDQFQLCVLGLRVGDGPGVQRVRRHDPADLDQLFRLLGGATSAGLDTVRPGRFGAAGTLRRHRVLPEPARGGRRDHVPARNLEATRGLVQPSPSVANRPGEVVVAIPGRHETVRVVLAVGGYAPI